MKKTSAVALLLTAAITGAASVTMDAAPSAPAPVQPAADSIPAVGDVMPEFPGGKAAKLKYLTDSLRYPAAAREAGKEGKVIVQFVIDREGNVTSPSVVQGASEELDAEALRLVGAMPCWTPGYQNGKPVKATYLQAVKFSLDPDASRARQLAPCEPKYTEITTAIIDGVECPADSLRKIPSDSIASMRVDRSGGKPVMRVTLKH